MNLKKVKLNDVCNHNLEVPYQMKLCFQINSEQKVNDNKESRHDFWKL